MKVILKFSVFFAQMVFVYNPLFYFTFLLHHLIIYLVPMYG